VADYDKVIPPGKEGKITAKIVGRKLHTGTFKKRFTVTTNDPERKVITLYLKGNVKKVFGLSDVLSLMGYKNDDIRKEIEITNLLDRPIRITGYKWSIKGRKSPDFNKLMDVKIVELEKGKKYKVKVHKKGDIPPGRYYAELILNTDYEKMMEKTLRFNLTVVPDVEVHPAEIFLGELRLEEGVSKSFDRIFSVIATRWDSLKVLKVVPESERITVATEVVKPGKAYKCTMKIRPKPQSGPFKSKVTIYTNYKGYEKIELPIQGAVRVVRRKK